MSVIVKACGNKPDDLARLFDMIAALRERQLRVFGEQKIDMRAGVLVGQRHNSPDFVGIDELGRIVPDAPPDSLVAVTHLDELAALIDLAGESGDATIQLHSKTPIPEHAEALKDEYPDRHFWHVIHAPQGADPAMKWQERRAIAAAHELVAAGVEAIVLDTYDAATDRVGGTGIPVSASFARRFRDAFKIEGQPGRLILAGGLNPGNAAQKIRDIQPDGIDANTGLNISRENRAKDIGKVRAFFDQALDGAYGRSVFELWINHSQSSL